MIRYGYAETYWDWLSDLSVSVSTLEVVTTTSAVPRLLLASYLGPTVTSGFKAAEGNYYCDIFMFIGAMGLRSLAGSCPELVVWWSHLGRCGDGCSTRRH